MYAFPEMRALLKRRQLFTGLMELLLHVCRRTPGWLCQAMQLRERPKPRLAAFSLLPVNFGQLCGLGQIAFM
jgi:hypothetical protein